MAAWVVIAVTDLNDYLVGAQVTALRSAALASGQADPFTAVMRDRASYVRNRISKRINISATNYAVPPELKTATAWLILEAMQNRLPLMLSEDKRMIERAYKDLDIAGTDDLPISTPADPMTPSVQASGGVRVVSKRTREATGSSMKGL